MDFLAESVYSESKAVPSVIKITGFSETIFFNLDSGSWILAAYGIFSDKAFSAINYLVLSNLY